jgi:hypothetical protein
MGSGSGSGNGALDGHHDVAEGLHLTLNTVVFLLEANDLVPHPPNMVLGYKSMSPRILSGTNQMILTCLRNLHVLHTVNVDSLQPQLLSQVIDSLRFLLLRLGLDPFALLRLQLLIGERPLFYRRFGGDVRAFTRITF